MAADQERAERIRALKQERPDLTWRRIAEHVGVTERSATDWQKKGGIEYENAVKLAALFQVDVDYIWRGEQTAPDPFSRPTEDRVQELLENVERLLEQQNALLARQSKILEQIEGATERVDGLTRDLASGSAESGAVLRGDTRRRAPKAKARSRKPNPAA